MRDTGKVVTNTKEVADYFGKEHFRVVAATKTLASKLEDGWSSIVEVELEASLGGGAIRRVKGYNLTYRGAKALVESFTGAKAKEQAIKFLGKVAEPPDITPVMQLIYPERYPTPPTPAPKQPDVIEGEYIRVEAPTPAPTPAPTSKELESMKAFAAVQSDAMDVKDARIEFLEEKVRGLEKVFTYNPTANGGLQQFKGLVQCILDARKSVDVLTEFRQEVDVFEHNREDYRDKKNHIYPVLHTKKVDSFLEAQVNKHSPDNATELLIKDIVAACNL